jgi:hypothetical protein
LTGRVEQVKGVDVVRPAGGECGELFDAQRRAMWESGGEIGE